uniref:hypothetical protein n=1 Tax=Thiocapsa marina TaxID=244573 RepID=UPI00389911CD
MRETAEQLGLGRAAVQRWRARWRATAWLIHHKLMQATILRAGEIANRLADTLLVGVEVEALMLAPSVAC